MAQYPVCPCAAWVKQCLCVCLSANKKNASIRVAKTSYSMQNNQVGHLTLYLIHVKVVLFAIISATSHYQFLDSTPSKLHVLVSTLHTTLYYTALWLNTRCTHVGMNSLVPRPPRLAFVACSMKSREQPGRTYHVMRAAAHATYCS